MNKVIQEEPTDATDPTTMGLYGSIGIVKGKPFNPDERMRKILTDAANIGAVTARSTAFKIRDQDAYYYPNSTWRLPFFGGYKFEVSPGFATWTGISSTTILPLASPRLHLLSRRIGKVHPAAIFPNQLQLLNDRCGAKHQTVPGQLRS